MLSRLLQGDTLDSKALAVVKNNWEPIIFYIKPKKIEHIGYGGIIIEIVSEFFGIFILHGIRYLSTNNCILII
jgi:hypothetical protein